MQWENLTAPDFARAVKETRTCVVPMGVLEKHGDHLPLGTDMLVVHRMACLAAEREPAVVFPYWYFGQIYEAMHCPGTVTLPPRLLLEVIEAVMDEIGRNGFTKIILAKGHGGNRFMGNFIAQCQLWREKPYTVYVPQNWYSAGREKEFMAVGDTGKFIHACEYETSLMLDTRPETVKMDAIPDRPETSLKRQAHVPNNFSGISWYAEFPNHYGGDARPATPEKGAKMMEILVDCLAEFIAAVKADKALGVMEKEFHAKARNPLGE